MSRKRGVHVLVALALLLVLPIVSAKIVIINDFRDVYNIGEAISVDGYLLAEETADGTIALELQCPGYSKVNSVHLTINKRNMVRFSQLGIGNFVLPDTEGSCDIEATFNSEATNSNSFMLLNDLLGAFEVQGDGEIQLGEIFTLDGIVFKLDGTDVESGTAQIFLEKQGEYPIQFGEATIKAGALDFSKQLSNFEYGKYNVDVKVTDGLNSQYFDNVAVFTIKTRFEVTASADKYTYEPGEEVVLKGNIDGITADDDVTVVVAFDSLRYNANPTDNGFEHRFFIPSNMKAGVYGLKVTVTDTHGNEGTDEFDITVKQVPTKIVNKLNADSYNPGETLTLDIQLLDQASQTMNGNVRVKITDPLGNELYNGEVNTRQEVELTFGQYAQHGTYTIVSTYVAKNLDDTDRVTVNQVESISSNADGRTIYVKNTGNIDYDKRVDLVLVSDNNGKKTYYVLAKDIALNPGEEASFDLSYDVPKGEYTVIVDRSGTVSGLEDDDLAGYVNAKTTGSEDMFAGVAVDDDQREFGTRLNQGFSAVTGASTISTYDRSFTPWFFFLMIILFGGLLGLYAYQRREIIKRRYKEYKEDQKRKKQQQESPIAGITHQSEGRGDVPQEEVDRLLARIHDKKQIIQPEKKVNIGTEENKRIASIKVKHVKPGTTTLVPKIDTTVRQKIVGSKKDKKEHGNSRNRFSTWNPPEHLLDDFKPKNEIKMEEKKEASMYEDIDEDFLRDEKFE